MNISSITLKQVIWRFQICNYFQEMYKFRDFINALMIFAKNKIVHELASLKISQTNNVFEVSWSGALKLHISRSHSNLRV